MNNKFLSFPGKLFSIYLISTFIMYIISPWEWKESNSFYFYLFNLFVVASFYFGYNKGLKHNLKSQFQNFNIFKILKYSYLINVLFIYQKFLFRLEVPSISISELVNRIGLGIFYPSIAYQLRFTSDFEGFNTLSNPIVFLYFIMLPIIYLAIPFSIYYWRELKKWQKFVFVLIVTTDILSYLAIGTNKGIFDYIIIIPFIYLAKNSDFQLLKLKNRLPKFVAIFLVLILFGGYYFTQTNLSRKANLFYYEPTTGAIANENAAILKIVPAFLENSYLAFDSYLTQGYYALSLAIEMEFVPTYGFGHSFFLTSLAEKILGKGQISDNTYQARLEKSEGYSHYMKWHTIYVWLANDVSFLFVPLIIGLIGFGFALVWKDVLINKNPSAIMILPLFLIMIFYFNANNQVLGFQGQATVFYTYLYFWLRKRKN